MTRVLAALAAVLFLLALAPAAAAACPPGAARLHGGGCVSGAIRRSPVLPPATYCAGGVRSDAFGRCPARAQPAAAPPPPVLGPDAPNGVPALAAPTIVAPHPSGAPRVGPPAIWNNAVPALAAPSIVAPHPAAPPPALGRPLNPAAPP